MCETQPKESVGLNPMVYRQTAASRFSHCQAPASWSGDVWSFLTKLVSDFLNTEEGRKNRQPLQADGLAFSIALPAELCRHFFSGVVELTEESVLRPIFGKRIGAVEDEAPFLQVTAVGGRKTPARHVDVIVYHYDALTAEERTMKGEGGADTEVTATWQVVSINARATEGKEPPTPMAMARNMAAGLGLPEGIGGTAREYSAEEFMQAILYWSRRAMAGD